MLAISFRETPTSGPGFPSASPVHGNPQSERSHVGPAGRKKHLLHLLVLLWVVFSNLFPNKHVLLCNWRKKAYIEKKKRNKLSVSGSSVCDNNTLLENCSNVRFMDSLD